MGDYRNHWAKMQNKFILTQNAKKLKLPKLVRCLHNIELDEIYEKENGRGKRSNMLKAKVQIDKKNSVNYEGRP